YAEYALATRMAHTVEEVLQFLHDLAGSARAAAVQEFAELEAFAGRSLAAWDVGFYAERLQRTRYSVSQEELRPYFPLPRVLIGLFEVAQRLVCGAALPVAYLVCNFLPPSTDRPALLTHDDVLTLFHEFGHGLHHLLTRVDYPSLAGINGVAWDAVELPSQFLENYAWHPDVLRRISSHVHSGAPLPAETQSRLIATRSFHAGLQMMRQLEFALFDFRLHAQYSAERGGRILEVLREV